MMAQYKTESWLICTGQVDYLGTDYSLERSDSDDYHNGYKQKRVNSHYSPMEIEVSQDRKLILKPQVIKK